MLLELKKGLYIAVLLFITFFFEACSIYSQMVDIPLISEKDELSADAGVSILPLGVHGTFTYGITNHFALQAFGHAAIYPSYYLQGAVGYYGTFMNKVKYEIYTGMGYGFVEKNLPAIWDSRHNLHYQLYFVQMNAGQLQCANHIDFAFSLKAGYMYSVEWERIFDEYSLFEQDDYRWRKVRKDDLIIEPGAMLRFGNGPFKFNIRLGVQLINTYNIRVHPNDFLLPFTFNVGAGMHYHFKVKSSDFEKK